MFPSSDSWCLSQFSLMHIWLRNLLNLSELICNASELNLFRHKYHWISRTLTISYPLLIASWNSTNWLDWIMAKLFLLLGLDVVIVWLVLVSKKVFRNFDVFMTKNMFNQHAKTIIDFPDELFGLFKDLFSMCLYMFVHLTLFKVYIEL